MKVFRFMSIDEFNKFISGETLVNKTNYRSKGNKTNSIGFCFMKYEDDSSITYAYEFLSGIVNDEICCVFETDSSNLSDSYGYYADPYGEFFDSIRVDEFCRVCYNNKDFKLLKYCKDYSFVWDKENVWIES